MKRFLWLTSIFIAPFLVLSGVVFTVIRSYGEHYTVEQPIAAQIEDTTVLYGCAYVDYGAEYKKQFTRRVNPEILVLGTSRTMQISGQWFTPRYRFYNAGGGAAKLNEFVPFLEQTESKPKLLLVGLDPFFFNERWDSIEPFQERPFKALSLTDLFLSNFSSAIQDVAKGKIPLTNKTHHIGINAAVNGNGFAADGSYQYGHFMATGDRGIDNDFADTYARIENGNQRFEWGDRVNPKALQYLEQLVGYCKNNGIRLVAFIPPYAPSVYRKMAESNNYGYINEIMPSIRKVFDEAGFLLTDFTDGSGFSTDSEYVDGFHGNPMAYQRMIQSMSANDSTLKACLR